jgi:hypothetical protein
MISNSRLIRFWLALGLMVSFSAFGAYDRILIPESCHPAIGSAAKIISRDLALPVAMMQTNRASATVAGRDIVLATAPAAEIQSKLPAGTAAIRNDGYAIIFSGGRALIYGVRPRSLLFAAGDVRQWKDRTNGVFIRDPSFAVRSAAYNSQRPLAEYVAELGVNLIMGSRDGAVSFKETLPEVYHQLIPRDQSQLEARARAVAGRSARFAQECRDADVANYPFLYGNDFLRWSPALYEAALKIYPSARGTPAKASWEQASLCPSDPMTWKLMEAYVTEFANQTQGDGLYVTYWDYYGLYCQCDRCTKSGLNQFSNQLHECVGHYHNALKRSGKKLIVRTWSSGVPHWLEDQWVHAPGYDDFGGSAGELWGRVIKDLPADIVIQTKVYHADCQPEARFSPLLGHAGPHREIAEYQITGQTTGRFYFPASTVEHTARTIRESRRLVGADGGVNVFPGGTQQLNYDLLNDIANSINIYAWRELSWKADKDVDAIWMEWAVPIFGDQAARHVVNALKLSEPAVNRLFSTLGLGTDTNSGFPENIRRRETLLKYTNRYYQPDTARLLEPTKENIQRVIDEKTECLKLIDEMFRELELARPNLRREQADELTTRFKWLREFALVNGALEESHWRYRYLRGQAAMLTTDPGQIEHLARTYDVVREGRQRLFQFDPGQKFSCYTTPLGQIGRRPSLGDPMPYMRELYNESRTLVEQSVGPDYLPPTVRR